MRLPRVARSGPGRNPLLPWQTGVWQAAASLVRRDHVPEAQIGQLDGQDDDQDHDGDSDEEDRLDVDFHVAGRVDDVALV